MTPSCQFSPFTFDEASEQLRVNTFVYKIKCYDCYPGKLYLTVNPVIIEPQLDIHEVNLTTKHESYVVGDPFFSRRIQDFRINGICGYFGVREAQFRNIESFCDAINLYSFIIHIK